MSCLYDSARIPISRRCNGYYIRWYYNGWHYWLWHPGRIGFITEGANYRTTGTRTLTVSSGQITLDQAKAIRTIKYAKIAHIYTDAGWATAVLDPGTAVFWNNYVPGTEIELVLRIGSRAISKTGFSPLAPPIEKQVFLTNRNNFGFLFNEFGAGVSLVGHLTITPDKAFSMVKYYLDWAYVIANQTSNTVTIYPLSKNTGDRRDGVITLRCPGVTDAIYIAVYQYETGGTQIFESDHDEFQFGWDEYGAGIMKTANLTVVPDQVIGEENTISTWATVSVNQVTNRMTVYPNDKNEGIERSGTITLSCLDADDIIIAITQFAIPIPDSPVATAATDILTTSFWANWQASGLASGYRLDVSKFSNFSTFVAGYENLDVGDVLTKQATGLEGGTDYYFRVRAYNINGTSANSNTIKVTTALPDSISLSIHSIEFDYLRAACTAYTITVTSSGAWTAAWAYGTHFDSNLYEGGSGAVCIISCNTNNTTPDIWNDQLKFTCGTAEDQCFLEQYEVDVLCT